VTSSKKEKIISSALAYLSEHQDLPESWRIDFVAVELDRDGKATRIEVIENAIN
jgi:Holliday junction resolvase-like predicted endonuclease